MNKTSYPSISLLYPFISTYQEVYYYFTHVKSNKDSILYQANTLLVHLQNHSCSCPKGDRSPRNRPVCVGKSERKSWNFVIFTEITSFAIHKCHLERSDQCWNNYIIRMQPTIVINCWILCVFEHTHKLNEIKRV